MMQYTVYPRAAYHGCIIHPPPCGQSQAQAHHTFGKHIPKGKQVVHKKVTVGAWLIEDVSMKLLPVDTEGTAAATRYPNMRAKMTDALRMKGLPKISRKTIETNTWW
jgi:hypothetical protein